MFDYFAYVLLAIVGLLLIGVVLLQDNRAGGLQAMTGSSDGGIAGKSTNTEMSKLTMILSMVFGVLLIVVGVSNAGASSTTIIDSDSESVLSDGLPDDAGASDDSAAGDGAAAPGSGDGAAAPAGGDDSTTTPDGN